jgi:2-oxoglutarate ferredoxin oxidoreductase subunit alpha
MASPNGPRDSVSIVIVGSGGAGALTAGEVLLQAAGRAGWYGFLTRSVGPQIRGGEAAALVRLSTKPVACMDDRFDALIALDWLNVDRFVAETPLGPDSLVVGEPGKGSGPPAAIVASGARMAEVPMKDLAKEIPDGRPNMIALGLATGLLGLPQTVVLEELDRRLKKKGKGALAASRAAVETGIAQAAGLDWTVPLSAPNGTRGERWLLTGNEAAGLGAIRGGVRFAAAYPITPATEVLEWLSPALHKVGGVLVQAEDEIASIAMIIGASFGGTPSVTATSGPGLSLMIEALGLATASETPIVIINVMRGGPSTGIPTKSEQSDLNIAVYGAHGDAPRIVVAPLSIGDCLFATQWATHLADAMQVPAIVLSDQFLGQARAAIDRPPDVPFAAVRTRAAAPEAGYLRYALTDDDVSPMAIPGTPGGRYTADGLTHDQRGLPSSRAEDHIAQLDKRRDKIERFDYGDHWAEVEGTGDIAIVTWGSLAGAAREAIARAAAAGVAVRLVAMRLISPAQPERLAAALDGVSRVIVLEQTHSGQFFRYLRAFYDLPGEVQSFHRPGPLPMRPGEIASRLLEGRAR